MSVLIDYHINERFSLGSGISYRLNTYSLKPKFHNSFEILAGEGFLLPSAFMKYSVLSNDRFETRLMFGYELGWNVFSNYSDVPVYVDLDKFGFKWKGLDHFLKVGISEDFKTSYGMLSLSFIYSLKLNDNIYSYNEEYLYDRRFVNFILKFSYGVQLL